MRKMKIPDGLLELGYAKEDIPDLVKGAIPQVKRILLCHLNKLYFASDMCDEPLKDYVGCLWFKNTALHVQTTDNLKYIF